MSHIRYEAVLSGVCRDIRLDKPEAYPLVPDVKSC